MSAKAYQIATSATAIASSVYAASLSGLSFERYWWHGVGLSFGLWSVLESRQSIKEQVEKDIRDCLNVCSLGFISKDSRGNTAGGYDSLTSVTSSALVN